MNIIKVLIPRIALFPLDYISDGKTKIGDLVLVPFRNKEITGIVWETDVISSGKKLKHICDSKSQLFPAKIKKSMIELIDRASNYYLADLGSICKLVMPVDVNDTPIKTLCHSIDHDDITLSHLSNTQQEALEQISNYKKPIILKGVTGSGKTEIYFHAIQKQLSLGKQALVMLPEIALSEQIIARFVSRFGFEPAIWNSRVTNAKKKRILRGILSGEVKVVIGARSALFLPYKELGFIVIDEEHDQSYKQDQGILYHARDMAVLRAHIEKCKIILVSATPSIESMHNVGLGKYQLVEIKDRFNDAMLPDIKVIDMKNESLSKNSSLSHKVIEAIKCNIEKKQQSLIFLNRRGYAPLTICKSCGYRFNCNSCSASMVLHKSKNHLECHHCGFTSSIDNSCPECKKDDTLILYGTGIERVAEEIESHFPDSNISIISKEQSASGEEVQNMLKRMEDGEIDILIGTQIVTKGYHFPKLTLVVIVDADSGFVGSDLRASERMFQLLQQVGGRAGRAQIKGSVLIQTYYPDNPVILALSSNKEEEFIKEEFESRRLAHMPPFTKMAAITITGKSDQKTLQIAKNFVSNAPKGDVRILGPSEATILKLADRYRYKILVIVKKEFHLQKYLELWKEYFCIPSTYHLRIDIDPYNFI
ncbi:primosomal protein N' [Rickettsiaceae bacterium]|nr:primosomal protein N' [Rickettsiaceae bacterium]